MFIIVVSNYSAGPWNLPLLMQWKWKILPIILQGPGTSLSLCSGHGTSLLLFFRALEHPFMYTVVLEYLSNYS